MDKKMIAAVLDEMGTLLELQGANPFKSRAFHNASRAVDQITGDLPELIRTGGFGSLAWFTKITGWHFMTTVTKYVSEAHVLTFGLLVVLAGCASGPRAFELNHFSPSTLMRDSWKRVVNVKTPYGATRT